MSEESRAPGLSWRLWLAGITVVVSCVVLVVGMALVHAVYFDRAGLPDVAPFLRFELPSTGRIQDERGEVRLVLSQGGSTLTQQLVRGYFLPDLVRVENADVLTRHSFLSRLMSGVLGAKATNKLLRKLGETRLSFWLEGELARRLGSRRRAKEEILARYASFVYLGNGRYGFEAASQYSRSVTPEGNIKTETKTQGTTPAGDQVSSTTTTVTGTVKAVQTGRSVTFTLPNKSAVEYTLDDSSVVPADLAIGNTVTVVTTTTTTVKKN